MNKVGTAVLIALVLTPLCSAANYQHWFWGPVASVYPRNSGFLGTSGTHAVYAIGDTCRVVFRDNAGYPVTGSSTDGGDSWTFFSSLTNGSNFRSAKNVTLGCLGVQSGVPHYVAAWEEEYDVGKYGDTSHLPRVLTSFFHLSLGAELCQVWVRASR